LPIEPTSIIGTSMPLEKMLLIVCRPIEFNQAKISL